MTESPLAPLLEPLSVRSLTVANRFVMAPMTRNFSPGGVPGLDVAGYYRRRAENGIGLIITEGVGIDHPASVGGTGLGETAIPHLFGDDAIAGWEAVVQQVHAADGKILPQLWHQGPMRLPGTGPVPDAPSVRPSPQWGAVGRCTLPPGDLNALAVPGLAMTESQIADVIAAYARSARAAAATGFDGIAIHGAHGYLIDAFLWHSSNSREDRWGGRLANRVRFAVEVVRAIRAAIGEELPILLRWSQWKQQDYDARLVEGPAELEMMLGPLVDAGVDIFDCSTRRYSDPAFPGSSRSLAGWTRRLTGKTTMAVGGVGLTGGLFDSRNAALAPDPDRETLARAFEAEEFDLIGVGRALLQDAAWLGKFKAGEPTLPFNRAEAVKTLS